MTETHTDPNKNWEVKASTGKHFDALDGIRGVAILMVVASHAFYTNPESKGGVQDLARMVIENLNTGVPIFFVLSGFLISFPFFRKKKTDSKAWYVPGYARRRIGKILPPFYLSIVVFSAWYLIHYSNAEYLKVAGLWATGTANFLRVPLRFNASYWSLIIEAHFYILLPLLFLLCRRFSLRTSCLGIFLILLIIPFVCRQLTWPASGARDDIGYFMTRFPCQLDYFAWGILFAGVFVMISAAQNALSALALFGYAGIIFLLATLSLMVVWSGAFNSSFQPLRWTLESTHLLMGLSSFLLLFFVFDPDCAGSRFFSNAPLRFIGIVSYEWFLFHQPVLYFFREHFGSSGGSLAKYLLETVVPLALTFGVSVLIYRYFSLPLLKYIRGDKKKIAVAS